jgi:hypothetical protein
MVKFKDIDFIMYFPFSSFMKWSRLARNIGKNPVGILIVKRRTMKEGG